jgi:imidazole glycerol-phosphate synthase subunit HisF
VLATRVMPCLLLRNASLVKTIKFRDPSYVGDPLNAIRIYNEKEVDELVILDITATIEGKLPSYRIIAEIATECFMPVAYGGGIRSLEHVERIFEFGIEKVAINSGAVELPDLVTQAATHFGSQSIVVSIDAQRGRFGGYETYIRGGRQKVGMDPVAAARRAETLGAGEILLTAMHRDGTMQGYDLELIQRVTEAVGVPVIACGGAGRVGHFREAVGAGASAVAAGAMVVYHGPHRAVLINFPSRSELEQVLGGTPA